MTPSTAWKEVIPADEAERFESYARELAALQQARAAKGKASRALHAKGVAGVESQFTVLPDLPEVARVGLFSKPATYPAYVRYSNGSPFHQPDRKPDVRGIAIKIIGVDGPKLIPGMEQARTQDFLLNRNPALPFATADQFMGLVRAGTKPHKLLPFIVSQFGLLGTLKKLPALAKSLGAPVTSLAALRYYSGAAQQFGPYAVRFDLRPLATDTASDAAADLRAELAQRLRAGPVRYELRIQFFVDEQRTPIEDMSVEWLESVSPFIPVAHLTLPQQDLDAPRARRIADTIETLSFDPWHTQTHFKPLGNIMRARNHAYRLSTQTRAAAPEPDGSERFDS